MLEFAFQQQLHIDLATVGNTRPWSWFARRVRVLLTTDNPLTRHFSPTTPAAAEELEW